MTEAYPAISCSSCALKDRIPGSERNFSTSRSDSVLPSRRVDAPMLSMAAVRRKANRRSSRKFRAAPVRRFSRRIAHPALKDRVIMAAGLLPRTNLKERVSCRYSSRPRALDHRVLARHSAKTSSPA
jgi:hypothetical protein